MNRVLIDQRSLAGPGSDRGLGRYAAQIMEAAAKSKTWQPIPVGSGRGLASASVRLHPGARAPFAVYHSTSAGHLPMHKRQPWVCSIQDLIPLDLSDYRRLGIRTRIDFQNARRSEVILANSRYTADRVMARLRVGADRIVIGSLPITDRFISSETRPVRGSVEARYSETPYVVALADLRTPDPRKRYHWITQLASALENKGIRVIVAGRGLDLSPPRNCAYLRELDDQALARLYAEAVAMFYPSAYEGQGLPPLEAMAAGCPVIAFKNTSITEMVSGGGFLLEDPVPWQSGRLAAPMPAFTVSEVQDIVSTLATDASELEGARDHARKAATRLTSTALTQALEHAYGLARDEWRSS